jgi:hypothetical protein
MEIGAAEYRVAAEEHLRAAACCHIDGNYLSCHYLSGLSVECILRAYRWQINSLWSGRHNLVVLFREAEFDKFVPASLIDEMSEHFGLITSRWANDHRYASPKKLLRQLNNLHALKNVKGDKMKKNSQEMYDAAEFIFGIGKERWK